MENWIRNPTLSVILFHPDSVMNTGVLCLVLQQELNGIMQKFIEHL